MDKILAVFSSLLAAVFPGFFNDVDQSFSGYVEADYVYVAPTLTGRITDILVEENQTIAAGDVLFIQEQEQLLAALAAARATAESMQAAADNGRTGARDEELDVVRAQLEKALALQKLAQNNLDRDFQIATDGFVASAKIDQEQAELDSATALVDQLKAQLASMKLPARRAVLLQADASAKAALAQVSAAQSRLDAATTRSPISGRVERVLFSVGEVAAVAKPVISILPEGPYGVIFYIPQTRLSEFQIGDPLSLSCDGCPSGFQVVLEQVDSEPEFTPPIIYSRNERTRMVFRAKARLSDGVSLTPGQPVSLESIE